MTSTTTDPVPQLDDAGQPVDRVRVAVIGAGFAGLGMAVRLRQAGLHDFAVFEPTTSAAPGAPTAVPAQPSTSARPAH